MNEIKGCIRYSPIRNNIIPKSDIIVLDVFSEDLCEYYQWFIFKKFGVKLHSPMFGTHVTIVKPEEIDKNNLWKKYENEIINVKYGNIERHWEFWSLNIISEDIVDIRRELGLNLFYRLHMTIGKQDIWEQWKTFDNIKHDNDYIDFIPEI